MMEIGLSKRRPTIDEIILGWKLSWGNLFPRNTSNKLDQFMNLLETIKNEGYTDIEEVSMFKEKIIDATVNKNYQNKAKLKIWKEINKELLDQAFIDFFEIVEIKEGRHIVNNQINYEPTDKIIDRPALDFSKLPKNKVTDTSVSVEEFLSDIERENNE